MLSLIGKKRRVHVCEAIFSHPFAMSRRDESTRRGVPRFLQMMKPPADSEGKCPEFLEGVFWMRDSHLHMSRTARTRACACRSWRGMEFWAVLQNGKQALPVTWLKKWLDMLEKCAMIFGRSGNLPCE